MDDRLAEGHFGHVSNCISLKHFKSSLDAAVLVHLVSIGTILN